MANSTINKFKYGYCGCGVCDPEIEVAGRKVGKTFMCIGSYDNMKRNEQIERQAKKNTLRTDAAKVRKLSNKREDADIAERSSLIADIDRYFSLYIRLKEADKYGMATCFTSGNKKHFKDLQCGHFISRSNLSTRWDVQNAKPQTVHENCHLHGNLKVFAENLEKEQKGIVAELQERARQIYKPSTEELKQLLIEWRAKYNFIKTKLENK
jgi:hypothetical protein